MHDEFLAGADPAAALKSGEIFNALKKALAERVLNAEMDYHLRDEAEAGNSHPSRQLRCQARYPV